MDRSDTCATERIGVVAWRLANGGALTTAAAANLVSITPAGARAMLSKLSRVMPIFEDAGQWQLADGCPGIAPKRPSEPTTAYPRT